MVKLKSREIRVVPCSPLEITDYKDIALVNVVDKSFNEILDLKIGLSEIEEVKSEFITELEEIEGEVKSLITTAGELDADYIIHIIKNKIPEIKCDEILIYYIYEGIYYKALTESLKLARLKTVVLPFVGEVENPEIAILSTIRAIQRFFEDYPESKIETIVIAVENEDICEGYYKSLEIEQEIEKHSNKKRELRVEKQTTKSIEDLNDIQFIEFGEDMDNMEGDDWVSNQYPNNNPIPLEKYDDINNEFILENIMVLLLSSKINYDMSINRNNGKISLILDM